ncbi:MAG: hypothetical protein E7256_02025 [Lachnospiraceae bacterium]|nr:hypothetical protein [Lachnospiraceae bacterium]
MKISKNLAGQIVNAIHEVCGCPINFINRNGIIIASTDTSRIDSFHAAGYHAIITQNTVIVEDDTTYTGTKEGVNYPILIDHIPIAVIGITGPVSEVSRYGFLATKVTEIFIKEQQLNKRNESCQQQISYIIKSCIYNELEDFEVLKDTLQNLSIPVSPQYAVLLFKLHKRYNPNNIKMIEHEITNLFDRLSIKLYTYIYPNEFVALIDEDSYYNKREALEKFCSVYRQLLFLGVGNLAPLSLMSNSYAHAKIALKYLAQSPHNYQFYEDFTIEMILGSMPDSLKQRYVEKILSQLTDEEISLLSLYLRNECNLKQTANDMFLHVNTMQYKLEKITTKTGFNPRHFKDAVVLYLAVLLRE